MIRTIALCLAISIPISASAQHAQHTEHPAPGAQQPVEAGQSAFAAIQEIVELALDDPETDWTKVNIPALQAHLVDMDNVTLRAGVETRMQEGGAMFTVTSGDPSVIASIQRMAPAHVATMNGVRGWRMTAELIDGGAVLTAVGDAAAQDQIRALGFIGVMTVGMHHQGHHLAIALGQPVHGHN